MTREKEMRKQETEQDSRRSFLTQPHRWSFIPFQQRKGIGIKQGNRSALSSAGVWSDLSGHEGRGARRLADPSEKGFPLLHKTKTDKVRVNPFL